MRDLYTLPLVGSWLERADMATKVQSYVAELPATVSTQGVTDVAQTMLGGMVSVVIVTVTTIAILLDGERLVALFRRAIPPSRRAQADRVGRIFHGVVGRYFGGSITVAVMMGLYVLTISLTFGVPLAPLAAVWAMITDLIPQIGGLLGGAFLAVLALAAGPGTAVIVVVLFVIYMNVENHVIQPAIIGNAVNLSPPTTMLAALIGGAAAGIPGALVATPLVGAVKQLYFTTRYPDAEVADTSPGLLARLATYRSASVTNPPADVTPITRCRVGATTAGTPSRARSGSRTWPAGTGKPQACNDPWVPAATRPATRAASTAPSPAVWGRSWRRWGRRGRPRRASRGEDRPRTLRSSRTKRTRSLWTTRVAAHEFCHLRRAMRHRAPPRSERRSVGNALSAMMARTDGMASTATATRTRPRRR